MSIETPLTERVNSVYDDVLGILDNQTVTLASFNNEQVQKDVLFSWFDVVVGTLERAETSALDPAMKALHWSGISNHVVTLENVRNNARQSGAAWLQSGSAQAFSALWGIRSALVWLIPVSADALQALSPGVEEIISQAHYVQSAAKLAFESKREVEKTETSAKKQLDDLQNIVEEVRGHERAAATATTSASASAATAESQKDLVSQYMLELAESVTTKKELFDEFEKYREQVEGTLQGASKVALAKSFERRRAALTRAQYGWASAFTMGILALIGAGIYITHELISSVPLIPTAAVFSSAASAAGASAGLETGVALKGQLAGFVGVLLRFFVLSPVIWFTWFSARQYGHCLRLVEDYAFKEAAAHAFVGYRSEMGDDADMIKMLRENAIKNFGSNPTRVLSKDEPVTPLNDAIERAIEKVNPDKLIELLKDAVSSVKK
ncbi:hypothetical protein G3N95_17880 [Paraburkholderia sp. Tr-20389]|uniref:hypothetical protein n=1 Tax=Paraburkholderia sp. Tr-20389 TaxID=2703903 RepID=UPI00198024C5|nr:hypothetical protein [Paraburkholderia sp. Tr-20389]MBN3754822.1 hypothetical protein [Paraburkholderia sp. Tr-20389]